MSSIRSPPGEHASQVLHWLYATPQATLGSAARRPTERCAECGFDADDWTDTAAVEAIKELPRRWRAAIAHLSGEDLCHRPCPDRWSIGEYTDHVATVLAIIYTMLATVIVEPGVDLGDAPEPTFDPEPRAVDIQQALAGIDRDATALARQLISLSPPAWATEAILDGQILTVHWAARHIVHATHHLLDIQRLRNALTNEAPTTSD